MPTRVKWPENGDSTPVQALRMLRDAGKCAQQQLPLGGLHRQKLRICRIYEASRATHYRFFVAVCDEVLRPRRGQM